MKRFLVVIFTLVGLLAFFTIAQANLINNPGFEAFTGTFTNSNFLPGNNSTWGTWLDRQVWHSVDGAASGAPAGWGGDNFARQGPTTNTTDLLMQGWDGTLTPAGTEIKIEFDHLYTAGYNPIFQVYGFQTTTGSWNFQAPFGPTGGTSLLNISNVGIGPDWVHKTYTLTIPDDFVAIAIGFIYGANDTTTTAPRYRGIDNVSVNSVPEPTTLLFLGTGLLALVGIRRKFIK